MNARFGAIALVPLLAGCGVAFGAGGVVHDPGYYEDGYYAGSHGGGVYYDQAYGRRVDYRRLPVPRGFLPAPGRCRVWLPGVPPGHQARSGSCGALQHRVPAGPGYSRGPRATRVSWSSSPSTIAAHGYA